MKKVLLKIGLFFCLTASLTVTSCNNQPKDSKIQDDFQAKAKENPQLRTISANVSEGVITLTGQCPDETCRTNAEQAAREVKGVKSVVNNITVTETAPVVIADDATLDDAVDEIVKKYKDVDADVENGVVTLRGSIQRDQLQQLMMDLNAANPKKVNNQLTVK